MEKTKVLVQMNQRLQATGLLLTADTRPSVFVAQVTGEQTWEDFWAERVQQARQSIQAYVWQGEILPTGRSAPAEAVPGASYVIVVPNGAIVFQYGDSPYAPETPGLAPGTLNQDNVEQAMEAHAQALAEELALEELAQAYINWVAEQVL
jgi:enamine deaminase RidA (YjgF/YER057c/UK114 family)